MPEIAPGSPTTGEAPATEAAEAAVAGTPPATVEETEAIWQKRIAGKDRAHAAEVAELRRQLAQGTKPAPVSETPEQQRIRELEEEIAKERTTRAIETRKARFPKAAEHLGDGVAQVDEAKLAGLEALLADDDDRTAPAPIARNSPARTAPAKPKSYEEMSKAELQELLGRIGPQYQESRRDNF